MVSGLVEKIGLDMGRLKHEPAGKAKVVLDMQFTDHRVAMDKVIELLMDPETGSVRSCVALGPCCVAPVGHAPTGQRTMPSVG